MTRRRALDLALCGLVAAIVTIALVVGWHAPGATPHYVSERLIVAGGQ